MNSQNRLDPERWVDKYADALYAFTVVRVSDSGIAEDLVQETFLSAWKAKDSYKGEASEKNWLYKICKNKIIDHYRKQKHAVVKISDREEDIFFDDIEHWTSETKPNDWGIDSEQPIQKKEFYSTLEKCKQKLKEIQQQVFVLKYMEDMDSDKICSLLGITSANYWVLIHRAKLHLRSCLEKNWINN